jgi:LPXTG-motif cell wall-anchored protein
MVSSHSPRHRSWYLAPIAAVVVLVGSVAFAASASAQPRPDTPSQSSSGHAAKAQGPKSPASKAQGRAKAHRSHTAGHTSGGSAVSLSRPNGFQAQADPDGMTNGGVDQPGGTGGIDTTSQDGNNGSGNDADCEDDNRGVGVPGHCKDRPGSAGDVTGETPDTPDTTSTDTTDTTTDTTDTTTTDTTTVVLPGALVLPPIVDTAPATGTTTDQLTQVSAPTGSAVAGASATTASQAAPGPVASILPNTGAGQALLALLVGGLAALTIGAGLLRRGRAAA